MNRVLWILLVAILIPWSGLYGHEGDHGEQYLLYEKAGMTINEDQAMTFAYFMVEKLVEKGKINKSWLKSDVKSVTKKKFNNEEEWVVNYFNSKEKADKKKNLFIFLSLYGKVLGANFTGK